MSGHLLDTNIASHVIRGDHPGISRRLASLPMADIFVSVVTEGELLYGLAKRNYPAGLTERVRQFLLRVDVLNWDREAAQSYADLRASGERKGVTLAPLDMMIAAHAVAGKMALVTRDKAFFKFADSVRLEDWSDGGA